MYIDLKENLNILRLISNFAMNLNSLLNPPPHPTTTHKKNLFIVSKLINLFKSKQFKNLVNLSLSIYF